MPGEGDLEGIAGRLSAVSDQPLRDRLDFWTRAGRPCLSDFAQMCAWTRTERWVGERPKLQPTWRQLLRILLAAQGERVDSEKVRLYQGLELGRLTSNNCVMELMPLPCKGKGSLHWHYHDWSRIDYLRDRELYNSYVMPRRIATLRSRIQAHRPRFVILYGAEAVKTGARRSPAPSSNGLESSASQPTTSLCSVARHSQRRVWRGTRNMTKPDARWLAERAHWPGRRRSIGAHSVYQELPGRPLRVAQEIGSTTRKVHISRGHLAR
jgi:hypothetical protein